MADRTGTPLPVAPGWGISHDGSPVMHLPTASGDAPRVSSLSQQIYLPEVFPIPSAVEFNLLGQAPTTAAGQVAIPWNNQPGGIYTVPPNTFGVIRSVSFFITDMLTTTNVSFSIIINTAQVQGYSQITIFPRTAPFVGNGFDSMVRFTGPADIQAIAVNVDGGTYEVGAAVSGWYWTTAADATWRTTGR